MRVISMNFGSIKDTVSKLCSAELIRESESKTFKAFTDRIKKDPMMHKQYLVFKNFEDCKPFAKDRLAERFINQNLNLFTGIDWNNLVNENKVLRVELLGRDAHVESRNGLQEMFEAVHVLIESRTKKGFSDFEREQVAYEKLVSFLTREVVEEQASKEIDDAPNMKDWKFITKVATNNFNDRYEHLNENEKKVFKVLVSEHSTKVNYLKDLKNEITEAIGDSEDKTLIEWKDKMSKIDADSINPAIIDDYILNCVELREEIKEAK